MLEVAYTENKTYVPERFFVETAAQGEANIGARVASAERRHLTRGPIATVAKYGEIVPFLAFVVLVYFLRIDIVVFPLHHL